jgi:DNA invertase Pin-like site-specific DNA recombinase
MTYIGNSAKQQDRLARSLADLLKLVEGLNGRGVTVEFVKENLTLPSLAMTNLWRS